MNKQYILWAILRISVGWVFFWAFIDKLFGLGFATCRDAKTGMVGVMCQNAWLQGGSPTLGFLKFGAKGPFADFYHILAGNMVVDWLFMVGLLAIGAALILGIGMRIAAVSGALMLVLMYTAGFLPPVNNPVVDDHLVYAVLLLALAASGAGQWFGLGKWWANMPIVKKFPILQ